MKAVNIITIHVLTLVITTSKLPTTPESSTTPSETKAKSTVVRNLTIQDSNTDTSALISTFLYTYKNIHIITILVFTLVISTSKIPTTPEAFTNPSEITVKSTAILNSMN